MRECEWTSLVVDGGSKENGKSRTLKRDGNGRTSAEVSVFDKDDMHEG